MLTEAEFNTVANFVREKFGLNFPLSQKNDLERNLQYVLSEFPSLTKKDLLAKIESDRLSEKERQVFIKYLTIGETYFFREKKVFDILFEEILPLKIIRKEKIRIWSAACSSGEEPYSIAILISEHFGEEALKKFEIYGSDINPDFIEKARKGIYREWSFRNCPPEIKGKYFRRKITPLYELKKEIKEAVNFSVFNLVDESFPEPFSRKDFFDFIFLRNVLIYFSSNSIHSLFTKLYSSLREEGFLITGITETALVDYPLLNPVNFKGVKLFEKSTKSTPKKRVLLPPTSSEIKTTKTEAEWLESEKAEKFFVKVEPEEEILDFGKIAELYRRGRFEEVLQIASKIVTNLNNLNFHDEKVRKAMLFVCKSYSSLGKIPKAIEICTKATEVFKLDEDYFYFLAVLLNEEGKAYEALKNLDKALFLKPDFAMANFLRANLLFKLNKNELAKKELQNTLNILQKMDDNKVLEETDGITVGSLKRIIGTMTETQFNE